MKITKDELIAENSQQKMIIEKLEQDDEKLRREFSKAFNAPEERSQYGSAKQITYSWFEIFREVGKLLQTDKEVVLQKDIARLETQLFELQDKVCRHRNECPSPTSL